MMTTNTQSRTAVSQATVARLVGVSQATVSLALAGDKRIAEATRQRVLAAADQLTYHPNINADARRLVARRRGHTIVTPTLGLVWAPSYISMHQHSFTQMLLNGIMEGCWESEQNLMLINLKGDHRERLAALSMVDGVILPSGMPSVIEYAQRLGKPLVTIQAGHERVPDVTFDERQAVRMLFEHLHARGHRQIGLISPTLASPNAARRVSAFFEIAAELDVPASSAHVILDDRQGFDDQGGDSLRQLWSRLPHPTAVIVYNDVMALSALRAAAELGIDVPGELSMVSIDGIPETATSRPALTTVAIDIEGMGRRAALMLRQWIQTGAAPPASTLTTLKLLERESVRSIDVR